jgi:hypothetical protein
MFSGAEARVAQLVEQATENRCVGGSIPPSGTIIKTHEDLFQEKPEQPITLL